MLELKPRAERAEEIAAGRTGARCPFCERPEATITTTRDRTGILAQSWECLNCDEAGPVVHGVLYWLPEGDPDA